MQPGALIDLLHQPLQRLHRVVAVPGKKLPHDGSLEHRERRVIGAEARDIQREGQGLPPGQRLERPAVPRGNGPLAPLAPAQLLFRFLGELREHRTTERRAADAILAGEVVNRDLRHELRDRGLGPRQVRRVERADRQPVPGGRLVDLEPPARARPGVADGENLVRRAAHQPERPVPHERLHGVRLVDRHEEVSAVKARQRARLHAHKATRKVVGPELQPLHVDVPRQFLHPRVEAADLGEQLVADLLLRARDSDDLARHVRQQPPDDDDGRGVRLAHALRRAYPHEPVVVHRLPRLALLRPEVHA